MGPNYLFKHDKAAVLKYENSGSLLFQEIASVVNGSQIISELVQVRNFQGDKVDVGIHLAGDLLR